MRRYGRALGVIGMVLPPKEAREVTKQLNAWYTSTPLPIYQPEIKAAASTISPTVNCSDSVNKFDDRCRHLRYEG